MFVHRMCRHNSDFGVNLVHPTIRSITELESQFRELYLRDDTIVDVPVIGLEHPVFRYEDKHYVSLSECFITWLVKEHGFVRCEHLNHYLDVG